MKIADAFVAKALGGAVDMFNLGKRLADAGLAFSLHLSKPYRIICVCWDTGGRQLVNRLAGEEGGWVGLVRVMDGFAPSYGKEWRAGKSGNGGSVWYIFDEQTKIGAGNALLDMHRFPEKYGKRQAPTRYRADKRVIEACDYLRKPEVIARGGFGVPRPVRREAAAVVKQQKMAMRN